MYLKTTALIIIMLFSNWIVSQTTFSEQAASWGINLGGSKDGGNSFADYDGDGDLDLLVNTNDGTEKSRLYRNNGNSTYTDVTSSLAPDLLVNTRERCAVWGDVNNDGRLDFMRNTSNSAMELYIQGVNGIFGDGVGGTSCIKIGDIAPYDIFVSDGYNSEGLGFSDFDGDGDLDIILDNHDHGIDILRNNYINHLNNSVVNPAGTSLFTHATPGSTTILGLAQSAIDGDYGSFTDVNNDGWVDIFMRKQAENDFFLNQGGTFTNGADLAEADNNNKGAVALYDFDNDGDFDAFWTENDLNQVFRNDGAGVWTVLGSGTGIPTTFSSNIDEVACGDLDNDGDIDILLVGDSRSYLYYNQLNSPTGGVGTGSANSFVLDATQSFNTGDGEGTSIVDIDDDGDMDIYMNIHSGGNQLWINNLYSSSTSETQKDYLFVEVLEDRSFMQSGKKRPALGATIVLLDCDDNVLSGIREVNGGGGHGTQIPNRVHFGLPWGRNYNYKVLVKFPNYKNGGTTTREQVVKWLNPAELTNSPVSIIVNATDADNNCPPVLEICNNGLDDDGDGLIDCLDPDCYLAANSGDIDTDNDGIGDGCDEDDDNDGILDIVECPIGTNSGLTGPLTTFTTDITTTNPASSTVQHMLNSITYNGVTYTDLILPDSYTSNFSLTNNTGVSLRLNGVTSYNITSSTYSTDILQDAFRSRNLNAYQQLDGNDYTDGDNYVLTYNNPITSSAGGFIAVTERLGNNPQVVEALDINGVVIGTTINVATSDYVDLGVNVYTSSSPQNSNMALYPIDDLAPVGTKIYGIKVSYGTSAINTSDGPDAKVFIIGDFSLVSCDYDGDGIPNDTDPDSDNDGCPDAIEGNGSFTSPNLTNDDQLTGGVGNDGIPNVVGSGQLLGTSQNASASGCSEICDNNIDDDGDGLIDCADSDCKPVITNVAVTAPTCANKTSGQIIITATSTSTLSYSVKNVIDWQSSNTFTNLGVGQYIIRVKNDTGCEVEYVNNPVVFDLGTCVEICNDGIDNDGDGLIDCDDPDCEDVGTATGINNN